MGKLSVLSTLGQPLKAEIEIVSLQRGEADSLTARLAPAQAFRQSNVELNPALLSLQFAIKTRPGGEHVLTLTSKQPINEPFIDMLVELNWSNGRLVREYTFLLDPPEYATPAAPRVTAGGEAPAPSAEAAPAAPAALESVTPAPAAATPESPAPAPAAASSEEPAAPAEVQVLPAEAKPAGPVASPMEPVPAKPTEPSSTPQAAEAAKPEAAELQSYEVKRGDTLSKIAIRNRIEGVSFQQMLVALFRANQDAFVAENMNRLRAGKIVNIPGKEVAAAVAAADARRMVAAQYADFNDYRRSLGIAVAAAPTPKDSGRRASGPISAPREEKLPLPKEPAKDELRLSRADAVKGGTKGGGTAAADDLAAKENALKEANERIAILEKNLQDLQKLVQLKSQTGTQLQQQAQPVKSAPAAAPTKTVSPTTPSAAATVAPGAKATPAAKPDQSKPAEAAKGEGVKTQAPKPVEAAKSPAPVPLPVSPTPKGAESGKAPPPGKGPEQAPAGSGAAKSPEQPRSDAIKAAPKAAPKPVAKALPPQAEVSFLDDLMGNPMTLGGAGGALLLLVGYAVYAWRKKRSSQFENSIMSVVPSDADSVLGSEGGRNVDTGSSSFQSDFSQGGISKMDTEEIDPIAEADVYMAYGRDAQAEEILKDALAKDSSRQGIRVKLLEIYANRKDTRSFEAAANELFSATGGKGADWEKIAHLGLSIDPGNPLYGGKPGAAGPGFMETAQIDSFKVPETEPGGQASEPLNIDFDIGTSTTGGGASPPPDFNLDAGSPSSAGASPAGLDFDLGLGADRTALQPSVPEASAMETAVAPEPSLSIDFDLPIGDAPARPVVDAAPSAPAAAPANLGSIDFDLGTSASRNEGTTEVSQTPPPLDVGSISLDLGAPLGGNGNGSSGGTPDARWQEVATKLDLAKAYEEMGDKDGARELLKEVVSEGDAAQQQQARTMLQGIG